MEIFIGGLLTETNTFSPFLLGRSGFEENGLGRDNSRSDGPVSGPFKAWRSMAERDGHHVSESIFAGAQPAGITVRAVYEEMRDIILSDLSAVHHVDVILLFLHGAMVADGYDDCEGDTLRRVRALKPDAVIGVVLDPHCHLTREMVEQADLIIIAKEHPHIDFTDRAVEVYDIAVRVAAGDVEPVAALVDTSMIVGGTTMHPPMSEIVAELRETEKLAGVLSVSLAHGFPWGDVADVGTRVLVYADQPHAESASIEACRLAQLIYDRRHAFLGGLPDIESSLARFHKLEGSVVLGDSGDNAGAGAPSDSTFFLRALLDQGIADAAIGAFWDPYVVQLAADAGVGARLRVRLGGKCGSMSGDPLDLEVDIMAVVDNHSQGVWGQRQQLGRSAWLRTAGIDILVSSRRVQIFDRDAFTGLGISVEGRRLVVAKSSNHYRTSFEPIADHVWSVGTPGTLIHDVTKIPYVKREKTFFPYLDDPWKERGKPGALVKTERRSPLTEL